ncbi:kinase-like protein [Coprinopsis marcescibilis]|uniref:Kinase-like protein n=1 Tax=Coprinopsis marcescibilis TaxID=230819 RepID=A0A5C3KTT3_COPMA|nr:kinase-like protein [Coprinopsis marcescibilis]
MSATEQKDGQSPKVFKRLPVFKFQTQPPLAPSSSRPVLSSIINNPYSVRPPVFTAPPTPAIVPSPTCPLYKDSPKLATAILFGEFDSDMSYTSTVNYSEDGYEGEDEDSLLIPGSDYVDDSDSLIEGPQGVEDLDEEDYKLSLQPCFAVPNMDWDGDMSLFDSINEHSSFSTSDHDGADDDESSLQLPVTVSFDQHPPHTIDEESFSQWARQNKVDACKPPFIIQKRHVMIRQPNTRSFIASIVSGDYPQHLDPPSPTPLFWVKAVKSKNPGEELAHLRLSSQSSIDYVLVMAGFLDHTMYGDNEWKYFIFPVMRTDLRSAKQPEDHHERDMQVKIWLSQATSAIGFVHNLGIMHRDIKPANFLLDYNGNAKLTDFGLAWVKEGYGPLEPNTKYAFHSVGTQGFTAPEVMVDYYPGDTTRIERFWKDNGRYTSAIDVYSLGVTMLCLGANAHLTDLQDVLDYYRTREPEFESLEEEAEVAWSLFGRTGGVNSPKLCALIWAMMKFDPLQRPSFEAIRNHPYFLVNSLERPGTKEPIFKMLSKTTVAGYMRDLPRIYDFEYNLGPGDGSAEVAAAKGDLFWINANAPPSGASPNASILFSIAHAEQAAAENAGLL